MVARLLVFDELHHVQVVQPANGPSAAVFAVHTNQHHARVQTSHARRTRARHYLANGDAVASRLELDTERGIPHVIEDGLDEALAALVLMRSRLRCALSRRASDVRPPRPLIAWSVPRESLRWTGDARNCHKRKLVQAHVYGLMRPRIAA